MGSAPLGLRLCLPACKTFRNRAAFGSRSTESASVSIASTTSSTRWKTRAPTRDTPSPKANSRVCDLVSRTRLALRRPDRLRPRTTRMAFRFPASPSSFAATMSSLPLAGTGQRPATPKRGCVQRPVASQAIMSHGVRGRNRRRSRSTCRTRRIRAGSDRYRARAALPDPIARVLARSAMGVTMSPAACSARKATK